MSKPTRSTIVSALSWGAERLWAALRWALRAWNNDIRQRKTMRGKALSGCLGLLVILIACSLIASMVRSAGEVVGLSPTRTPRPSATTAPTKVSISLPSPSIPAATTQAPAPTAPPSPTPGSTPLPSTATLAPAPSPSATQSPPTIVTSAPTIQPPATENVAPPGELLSASVVRVIDGDTVDVSLGVETVRLRLIGIDTPETKDPRKPVECFGREATQKAEELLNNQTVLLEADPSQDDRDIYGRLLRYIWLSDSRLFNQEMIAQGYAFEYTYGLPYKYQAEFQQAQRQAREQQRGLWSPDTCNGQHTPADVEPPPPQPAPTAQPAAPAPVPTKAPLSGQCDPSYPDVCIPPPPPDLDCGDIPYKRFRVLPPDPHRFDGDHDGIGCER
jgi:endonuclease YncB( thermonuclease family)